MKRQEEDAPTDDVNAEQLCDGRPAEEYFRLSTDGDCRDVVRWVTLQSNNSYVEDIQNPQIIVIIIKCLRKIKTQILYTDHNAA